MWTVGVVLLRVHKMSCHMQVYAVGSLFGVHVALSHHPDCFHEKFRLTHLRKGHEAGTLTHYGDMLVCSFPPSHIHQFQSKSNLDLLYNVYLADA